MHGKEKGLAILATLGEELSLQIIKRSRLRWFGQLVRMSRDYLPLELYRLSPIGLRSWGRPKPCYGNYISQLAWEHLGIPQVELASVLEVWANLFS